MGLSPRGLGVLYEDDKDILRRLRERSIPAARRHLTYSTADAQSAATMTTHPTAIPMAALRGNAATVLSPGDDCVGVAVVVVVTFPVSGGMVVSPTLFAGSDVAIMAGRKVMTVVKVRP